MTLIDKDPHMAEVKLIYKSHPKRKQGSPILSADDAHKLLRRLFNAKTLELREEFVIVLLNASKLCIGWCRFAIGGKTSVNVDVAQLVSISLLSNAHSVLVAHSHPSGNRNPSQLDISITRMIINALHFHGIELLDHIIMTKDDYRSMREVMNFSPATIPVLI
jgi:DNA repair protein RadC